MDDWRTDLADELRAVRDAHGVEVRRAIDPLLLGLRPELEVLDVTTSPLATPAGEFARWSSTRQGKGALTARVSHRRGVKLHGITLHTSGSSVVHKARRAGATSPRDVLAYAMSYYERAKWPAPHYTIGWDEIGQSMADDRTVGAHAGITSDDGHRLTREQIIRLYATGGWERYVSPLGAGLWHARWPDKRGPHELVPNGNLWSVNAWWLGIEMIPCTDGRALWAEPAYPGARFTARQHELARNLCHDIAARNGLPWNWAAPSSTRLVSHSDLNPIQRDSASLPLWDCGYHTGLWDMDYVRFGGTPRKRSLTADPYHYDPSKLSAPSSSKSDEIALLVATATAALIGGLA